MPWGLGRTRGACAAPSKPRCAQTSAGQLCTSGMCTPLDIAASIVGHRQLRVRSQAHRAAGTLCLYGNSLCQAAKCINLAEEHAKQDHAGITVQAEAPLDLPQAKCGCNPDTLQISSTMHKHTCPPPRARGSGAMVASRILNLTLRMGSSHSGPSRVPHWKPWTCTQQAELEPSPIRQA